MNWLSEFLSANWFNLVQSIAILAGLLVTLVTLQRQMHQTRVANSLLVTQHHREIWTLSIQNRQLSRVFTPNPDLQRKGVTEAERTFVNMIFLHMCASLKAVQSKTIYPVDGMEADLADIMSFPIPAAVWREVGAFHDQIFVRFVENKAGDVLRATLAEIDARNKKLEQPRSVAATRAGNAQPDSDGTAAHQTEPAALLKA